MKTTNNVQKTENKRHVILLGKIVAIVLCLILVDISASAFGISKYLTATNARINTVVPMVSQKNTSNKPLASVALLATNHSGKAKAAAAKFEMEVVTEKSLEIESWMTEERFFVSNLLSGQIEKEEPLSIENWMVESTNFRSTAFATDHEPALETESWMLDEKIWKN